MNLMTSSPDVSDITRSSITVTGVTTSGGFATAECDGQGVYISRSAVKRLRLQPGDTYEADLVPNKAQPDKTPWFAMHVIDPQCSVTNLLPSDVLEHLLSAGDAWTARDVCEVFLDREPSESDEREMHRLLDTLFLSRRGVAKIMLYSEVGAGGASRTWFTAYPERIDVGEFEDDEG